MHCNSFAYPFSAASIWIGKETEMDWESCERGVDGRNGQWRKAQQQNANEALGKRGFRYHCSVRNVWLFRTALLRSPINRMYLPTHTQRTPKCVRWHVWADVYTRRHRDTGSPQWIAFTRRTTTDIPTFIHGLYASSHMHPHTQALQKCICTCTKIEDSNRYVYI